MVKKKIAGGAAKAKFAPKMARGLPTNARLVCADNTGAEIIKLIGVVGGYHTRWRRNPAATIGDMISAVVIKGKKLRKEIVRAIIVRQAMPFRRKDGTIIRFEDNAAVLVSPDGAPRGTEIKGAVAKEAAERWSDLAALAKVIV